LPRCAATTFLFASLFFVRWNGTLPHYNGNNDCIKLKLHLFDLLWICCTTSCSANPQLFDKSTTNPQISTVRQIHIISTCQDVVDYWIYCGLYSKFITNRNSGVWLSTRPQQIENLYNTSTAKPQLHAKNTGYPNLYELMKTSNKDLLSVL
jgi:hypothetical protein